MKKIIFALIFVSSFHCMIITTKTFANNKLTSPNKIGVIALAGRHPEGEINPLYQKSQDGTFLISYELPKGCEIGSHEQNAYKIAADNKGKFVILGDSIINVFNNRQNYHKYPLQSNCTAWNVAWNGLKWVVVGDQGTICTSEDGINWQEQSFPDKPRLTGIASDGYSWIAVGDDYENNGVILKSPNGYTWNKVLTTTNAPLRCVAYDFKKEEWMATKGMMPTEGVYTKTYYTSTNEGTTWTPHSFPYPIDAFDLASNNDSQWATIGQIDFYNYGILTSDDGILIGT